MHFTRCLNVRLRRTFRHSFREKCFLRRTCRRRKLIILLFSLRRKNSARLCLQSEAPPPGELSSKARLKGQNAEHTAGAGPLPALRATSPRGGGLFLPALRATSPRGGGLFLPALRATSPRGGGLKAMRADPGLILHHSLFIIHYSLFFYALYFCWR